MEHTPGRWIAINDDGKHKVFGPHNEYVALVQPRWHGPQIDDAPANAKLMAASPGMLEALEGVVCANMIVKSGESDEHSMTMQDAIDAARAAIEAAS